MDRDFTLLQYERLLSALQEGGYRTITSIQCMENEENHQNGRLVILRHDVDKASDSVLSMAQMENSCGMQAIYYFRSQNGRFDCETISEVKKRGHNIGYHYENLSRTGGDTEKAMVSFQADLAELRRYCQVTTICQHGSPLSKWDNTRLWDRYDYRDFGILFEPYLDLDFDKILYLTDTGRRWDGANVNVRDKVESSQEVKLRTTPELVEALAKGSLPDRLLINSHPHRWVTAWLPWLKELFWQNTKNLIKRARVIALK